MVTAPVEPEAKACAEVIDMTPVPIFCNATPVSVASLKRAICPEKVVEVLS